MFSLYYLYYFLFMTAQPSVANSIKSMEPIEILSMDQLDKIFQDTQKYILIDFYAKWCKKCIILEPKLKKLIESEYNDEVLMVKIQIDKNDDIAIKYNIMTLPTIIIFDKDGQKQPLYEPLTGSNGMIEKVDERLKLLNKKIVFEEDF